MRIELINDITVLFADEGKGIIKKGTEVTEDTYKSTEMWLGKSDVPENYEEVDLF